MIIFPNHLAAEDCHFISDDGRRVFDSLSGLWCCGYGHNRPEITAAITAQLATLDYAPAFQYTHPGATTLADRLTAMAPGNLDHAIFTNSGSECADTALKLARAYWRLKGQPSKTRFIGRMYSLDNAEGINDITKWFERLKKITDKELYPISLEPKIDGLAISITYKDGILQQGLTGGDVVIGEDVTHNVKAIMDLP